MSTISTIHTLVPGGNIPLGYFDEDNIRFIQKKIIEILRREIKNDILFDRPSIIRIMERVLLERIENIPSMNNRVLMYLANEYRVHQAETSKRLNWEENFVLSQRFFDPLVAVSRYDQQLTTPPNRLNVPRVGGTTRFYFT